MIHVKKYIVNSLKIQSRDYAKINQCIDKSVINTN